MTEENTNIESAEVEESQQDQQGINISIEQILAAVLHTTGKVVVKLEDLVRNYAELSVKVDQDPETKELTFSLAKIEVEEVEVESESASE